jgi:enamine deaminase RidA (YjgF/YER057c/UK114 family)
MMGYEEVLKRKGYKLPEIGEAIGLYVPVTISGQLLFTSGLLPELGDELVYQGKLGSEVTTEQGKEAARLCALNALAVMKAQLGDLAKVKRILRVVGYINSAPGFTGQPSVLNGASEVLIDIFGEAGKHARLAIGVAELPLNASVEIEVIAEIDPEH